MDSDFPQRNTNKFTPQPIEYDKSSESNRLLPSSAVSSSFSSSLPISADAPAVIELDDINNDNASTTDDGDDSKVPSFSWKKLWMFTGPGILMSTAFLDPGNLEGDLQAGAIAGYSLLWLLFWATMMGLLVQLLAARVGVSTGKHLAELCREEYPPVARFVLWVMVEVALIAADIQEVIGTAIAIQILSGGVIPLWASVVITALDCFAFLFLENYGVRKLEAGLAILIGTMAAAFAWMFSDARPSGERLLIGVLVPKLSSKTIQQAVGFVGCVITPHNVFLHSALVQSREIDPKKTGQVREALNYYSIESSLALLVSFMINLFVTTVFAKGFYGTKQASSVGLKNAGEYLEEKYGGGLLPVLYLWGIGLLAAGQSSTITGTYAGQFIMGGFLNLRLKQWLRAVITRSFAIVPTMILAIVSNRSEAAMDLLNEWLNVVQSMQIPFALIPLFTLVSKKQVMGEFRIGSTIERLAWIVVALVMLINVYVLYDLFMNAVNGLLSGFLFFAATTAYVAFIIYLISRDGALPSSWLNRTFFERFSYTRTQLVQPYEPQHESQTYSSNAQIINTGLQVP
ncbi:Natural resistance-associated macrophage protein 2 [Ancistrocladus abbreviatus]